MPRTPEMNPCPKALPFIDDCNPSICYSQNRVYFFNFYVITRVTLFPYIREECLPAYCTWTSSQYLLR